MKKGKVFGKTQIALVAMVLALGAAVWLNVKYTSSSKKFLGEATLVSSESSEPPAVETAAKPLKDEENDYFATAKKERAAARKEQQELIEETLKSEKLNDADKNSLIEKTKALTDRIEHESSIEALLKAKGFERAVAVISDDGISVIVGAEGLTSAQTLQIQDIVTGETEIPLAKIKIVTVK